MNLHNVMPHHIVPAGNTNTADPYKWCYDMFGKKGIRWKTMNLGTVFCFRDEQDAIVFSLRWK